jgi:hypothetical protein
VRLCRPRAYADVGIGSPARCGLPCDSGRHNPDMITSSHRGTAEIAQLGAATPTVGTSKEFAPKPLAGAAIDASRGLDLSVAPMPP